jgi:hypothetical protein
MPGVDGANQSGLEWIEGIGAKLWDRIKDEAGEEAFDLLLGYMQRRMGDPEFSRTVGDFNGRYQFRSRDGGMKVLVRMENGRLEKSEEISEEVDVTVTFKDGGALMRFLLRPAQAVLKDIVDRKPGVDKPHTLDILQGLLNNEVKVTGNVNYLYRFAFIANHLLLEKEGELPR